jgi:hypothetical protein
MAQLNLSPSPGEDAEIHIRKEFDKIHQNLQKLENKASLQEHKLNLILALGVSYIFVKSIMYLNSK